ncbi:hypothetical protein [Nocardioides sp. CER19]|uniref:hypothetical protein n=1 Tax=Nocardioides sp. CER19 TaxID=3038538 RepID=UPI00244687BB|nr:hypothetical protein [Nocardioides sp. CER19]MDH2413754.1 hypothetical protein [Nocardioides sp. CER19]
MLSVEPLLETDDLDAPEEARSLVTRLVNEAFIAYVPTWPGADPDESLLRAAALVLRDELTARVCAADEAGRSVFDEADHLSDLAAQLYLQSELRLSPAGGKLWRRLITTGFGLPEERGRPDWQIAVEVVAEVLKRLAEVDELEAAYAVASAEDH